MGVGCALKTACHPADQCWTCNRGRVVVGCVGMFGGKEPYHPLHEKQCPNLGMFQQKSTDAFIYNIEEV